MRFRFILVVVVTFFLAETVAAGGIPINPGQWEMTSTMTMTMMPTPQTTTVTECIDEDELDPEAFNMDADTPCTIEDITIDGNTLSWSIDCPTEGGPVMEGQWEMISKGDSITGSGHMSTEFGGQKMGFNMTWDGKRIGDCE